MSLKTALLALVLAFPAAAQAASLDGTQWKIRPRGVMGTVLFWRTDVLMFEGGMLTSTEEVQDGFLKASYTTLRNDGQDRWTAIQTNSRGERIEWNARWNGKRMKGTATFISKNGNRKIRRWKAFKVD